MIWAFGLLVCSVLLGAASAFYGCTFKDHPIGYASTFLAGVCSGVAAAILSELVSK